MKYQSMQFLLVFLLMLGMHQEVVDAQLEPYTNQSLQRKYEVIPNPRTGGYMTSRRLSEMEVHGSTLDYRLPFNWRPELWWADYDHQVVDNDDQGNRELLFYRGFAPRSVPYFGTGILPFLELVDAMVHAKIIQMPDQISYNYLSVALSDIASNNYPDFSYITHTLNSKGSDPQSPTKLSARPRSLNNASWFAQLAYDRVPLENPVINKAGHEDALFLDSDSNPLEALILRKGHPFYWDSENGVCGFYYQCITGQEDKNVWRFRPDFNQPGLRDKKNEETIAAIYDSGHEVLSEPNVARRLQGRIPWDYYMDRGLSCGGAAFRAMVDTLASGNPQYGVKKTILIQSGLPKDRTMGVVGLSLDCDPVITVFPYLQTNYYENETSKYMKLVLGAKNNSPGNCFYDQRHFSWCGKYLSMSDGFNRGSLPRSSMFATRWAQALVGLYGVIDPRFVDDPHSLLVSGSTKSAARMLYPPQTNLLASMPVASPPCGLLQAFMTLWGGKTRQGQLIDEEIFYPAFDSADAQRASQLYNQFKLDNGCRITVPVNLDSLPPADPPTPPGAPEYWAPYPWAL